ncbi:uncharacterized protein LOC123270531 [Cotesia glomerata]|uniref:Uncharacterized protein n=1 Tax=Cotesia glomerata TaxID=32391 RepID=A0AAV7IIS3_COTGL|nr:uncharacterized protein LOC123270531 [Cotesia glomerata]KAH0552080.1 hypothetical protein KQX54_005307 [Cotesia glomerata]
MARFAYECNDDIKLNDTNYESNIRTYMCPAEKSYCLYCCCNPQCCLLIQRRPPKHFWEAWYFWLGIALLIFLILSSISTYIVSNCRYGFNLRTTSNNLQVPSLSGGTRINDELNEISIHVIPTTDILLSTSHIKMQLAAPQPNAMHMTPIVA